MNIVNKLTLRHLKENKGRSVVTTFGIIVSVAMITAVLVAMASFLTLTSDISIVSEGNFAAKFIDISGAQTQNLYNDDRIETVGLCNENFKNFKLDDGKSDRLETGTIAACDSDYFKMFVQADYDGILPQNDSEIAVDSSFIKKNNLDWSVGDIVSIPCGKRYVTDKDDKLEVSGNYSSGEEFEKQEVKSYKITAILHENSPTSSTPILTCLSSQNAKTNITAIQLKKLDRDSLDVVNDITKKNKIENKIINTELLYSNFAYGDGSIVATLMPLVVIVLIIIMCASVVLIYNAFAMSLSEKVKYLGMLSSVGATKKQKRLSIYYEGFILALFGIPLGMLAGVGGIGITLKALGKKIISTGMIMGVTDENVRMKVEFPIWAVATVLVLGIITIFVSCTIPANKASKISIISALRSSDNIKVKPKTLKCSKYIKTIFGYEGELAYKNLKRNGRKARVITVSIALSIVLFLSCNYFCSIFLNEVTDEKVPYQVGCTLEYDKKDEALKQFAEIDKIDDAYCTSSYFYSLGKTNSFRKDFSQFWQNKYLTSAYKGAFDSNLYIFVNLLDDDMFSELCEKNGIDSSKYYGNKNECKVLLMNNISHLKSGQKVFNDNILNTKFKEVYTEEYNLNFEIGDFVKYSSLKACNLNRSGVISLYAPYSEFVGIQKSFSNDYIKNYFLGIETSDHKYVSDKIDELSEEGTCGDISVIDYAEQMQTLETVALIIQVFVYGFIALISLITVFNIINTVSSGISSRKKEFAMLKSVGITPKGFNKMVMLESAFYGIKAVIVGLPLSALISFVMSKAIDDAVFSLNWQLYLIVSAVVFAIIGLTMLYSVKKVQQDNIIETLKQDIN